MVQATRGSTIGEGVRTFDARQLAYWLAQRGVTVTWLGARLGVHRSNVSGWVHGRASPAPRHLRAVAEALDVQPRVLTTVRPADAELYDRRVWAGLSIREAARAARMPWQTYAAVEAGTRPLAGERVPALAKAFGCSPSTIQAAYRKTRARLAAVATATDCDQR